MIREQTYINKQSLRLIVCMRETVSTCRINVSDIYTINYVYEGISRRWNRQIFMPTEHSVVIQSAISPHTEHPATTSAERPLFYPAVKSQASTKIFIPDNRKTIRQIYTEAEMDYVHSSGNVYAGALREHGTLNVELSRKNLM